MSKSCAGCGTKLGFLNSPTFNAGELKDKERICYKCFMKMAKLGLVRVKGKVNYFTKDEICDIIANYESKIAEKKSSKIQNEAGQNNVSFGNASTRVIQSQQVTINIADKKHYSVKYLGGFPGYKSQSLEICPTSDGIYTFSINVLSFSMSSLFTVPWQQIKNIEYRETKKGGDAEKNALLTAGFVKKDGLAFLAGLATKGQTTNKYVIVTSVDNTGYEGEIIFESDQAQKVVFYLNEQRSLLYKPAPFRVDSQQSSSIQKPIQDINDPLYKLERLSELLKKGLVTEQEYEFKKKELLDRL